MELLDKQQFSLLRVIVVIIIPLEEEDRGVMGVVSLSIMGKRYGFLAFTIHI